MQLKPLTVRAIIAGLLVLALVGAFWTSQAEPGGGSWEGGAFPGIVLGLTAEARQVRQVSGQAFPEAEAGFSAYYRRGAPGSYGLDKDRVDGLLFGPVAPGAATRRAGPAILTAMGANYTVASLPLQNIDGLVSPVNLYYDDQGWVVAYLPRGAASAQIWQAAELDGENPVLTDASLSHTLLDAINVVLAEALGGAAVVLSDPGLSYHHWRYDGIESFLLLAAALGEKGSHPVSFSVPAGLVVREVSATLWVSQDAAAQAPCAALSLNGAALIGEQCARGLYHTSLEAGELYAFQGRTAHNLVLTQSERDAGASGALLLLAYETAPALAPETSE